MKGVVGGAASSASKMTDALDNFVRGAGQLDDTDALSPGTSLEKVRVPIGLGCIGGEVERYRIPYRQSPRLTHHCNYFFCPLAVDGG